MKKKYAVMITGIVALLINVHAFAQITMPVLKDSVIAPYRLAVTFYKTTNLIYPCAIKSVDIGSEDILAQKANGVENVLQVKAGKLYFDETNLTVITADGKLYSYILDYSDTPGILNIRFYNSTKTYQEAFFSTGTINEAQIQADAKIVIHEKINIHGIKDKSYGIKIIMNGLFIKDDVIYCRIKLANNSNINYDIEQLRFYIRDQRKSTRTAMQELEIHPLYVYGDTAVVPEQTEKVFVFALQKFTIPEKKYLAIELMEKSGGRHLRLHVRNRTILQVRLLK